MISRNSRTMTTVIVQPVDQVLVELCEECRHLSEPFGVEESIHCLPQRHRDTEEYKLELFFSVSLCLCGQSLFEFACARDDDTAATRFGYDDIAARGRIRLR